ncbi:MAG: citrate lyase holo-[acyl-carrier protein] synthase [Muribaculaceae bacterium]|nr:citrate lyase holo-[acyl-carrier protein] synthase [Muribaculaceae bacterium]
MNTRVSLEDMLAARDERQAGQRRILAKWPGKVLILMTIVAPGVEKRNHNTQVVAAAGAKALAAALAGHVDEWFERDLPTGYELWMIVDIDPRQAKRITVDIEEQHPLGRFMDIDVIGQDLMPLQRQSIGAPARRCLICGENARLCMRRGTHSYSDLIKKITDTVDAYVADV